MALADIFQQLLQKRDAKIGPDTAAQMAAKGRGDDSIIAHINPREAAILKALGGSGKTNPETGAMEFDDTGSDGGDPGGPSGDGGWGGGWGGAVDNSGTIGNYGNADYKGYNEGGNDYSANDAMGGNFGFGGGGNNGYNGLGPDLQSLYSNYTNAWNAAQPTISNYASPQGADLHGGLYDTSQPAADSQSPVADTLAGALDPNAVAGAPPATQAPAAGTTPGAGAIAPDAAQGWNPLQSWQASFGPELGGSQEALARTDQGETVYGNDPTGLGNLRGFRDNTNFQVDGFQVPGNEGAAAYTASGLGDGVSTVDPERPDASTMNYANPRGQGVESSWSNVGPASFGISDPDAMTNAGATQNPNAPNMGSAPMDDFGARVPQITPNYRDVSSFSAPMADAIQRAYEQNPNLPQGYLEGMYGIESTYGTNLHRPGSQFEGPYQFSRQSMQTAAPQLGNITSANLQNPYDNMQALNGEFASMVKALGRNPTAEEAYAMHQQGIKAGARSMSDPYASMADLGTPVDRVTANHLPADANYRDFIEKFGTPFGSKSNYSPDTSVQGPAGIGSMFR